MASTTNPTGTLDLSTGEIKIGSPSDTPLVPATPKSAKRSTSKAATTGRAAVARAAKAKATPAKPAARKGAKVATPAKPARKLGPAPKIHPIAGKGCLVMLGDPAKPTSVKVAFVSESIFLDESVSAAVAAGAVTAEQVAAGHVFACQTRNVWQRAQR